ncbi:MAG: hypothetical protein ABIT01_13580 [Thermoanaerobaculia bacterium]
MKERFLRLLVSLVLVLGVSGMTVGHSEPRRTVSAGGQLEAHHHGPHAPCPEAVEHHCLACAAQSLFAPAPRLVRVSPPRFSRALWARAEVREGRGAPPRAHGRSPPSLPSIA